MFLLALTPLLLYNKAAAFLPAQQRHGHRELLPSLCLFDEDRTLFSRSSLSPAAPVFITISPPSSGKTEALRSHLLSQGYNPDDVFSRDVALDDQSSVYHRIPLAAFLFPNRLDPGIAKQLLKSGSTVQDRLLDPSYDRTDQEIRNIILRLAGRITNHTGRV